MARLPFLQATQLILPCIAAALAICVLSLGAHTIAFGKRPPGQAVPIFIWDSHFTLGTTGSQWEGKVRFNHTDPTYSYILFDLLYWPENYNFDRVNVLLAGGVIAAIGNVIVIALLATKRMVDTDPEGTKVSFQRTTLQAPAYE